MQMPLQAEQSPKLRHLPLAFRNWFSAHGWTPRPHQLDVIEHAREGRSTLLISPTGGGKTLAGFLPSLVELREKSERKGIHTLYVSPLKALAVDIARNLEAPVAEMKLPIAIETRTGDTPHAKRRRQREKPPDILITTPEQLSLLIADPGAGHMLKHLRAVVLDELHSLVTSKRGALLALALARIARLSPGARRIGLSATVADPQALSAWLVPQAPGAMGRAELVLGASGAVPSIAILESAERVPWAGHSALYAVAEIYAAIRAARLALIFVNTRSQAEMVFQALWEANDDGLPIALHHGSLDVAQRRKVEAAMAAGRLRAVVCTSTLDLGIDWGDVDLVVHIGAPKGSSRLLQRIGRANHRLDEPSRALLVPSNRFEVLECEAARQAARQGAQDSVPPIGPKLDVLAQHILGIACAGPFHPQELYDEVVTAWPYRGLARADFDAAVDFVSTGGYALRAYERYAKLRPLADGRLRLAHPALATRYRLNMGTIVEADMLKVRLARITMSLGRRVATGAYALGEIEEWFLTQLKIGDTFLFAGQVLRFEGLDEFGALASRTTASQPMIPSYQGGKFPLSTTLAGRVREMLADDAAWPKLPRQVRDWLCLQQRRSLIPSAEEMLAETFPRADKHYLVCYPFEGRLAHQSLGMLLTRRLERGGWQPLGFLASEYALAIWTSSDLSLAIAARRLSLDHLFDEDMLGDDLDAWLAESNLMKRTFRNAAIIAGLIERRWPGKEKTARQVTVNSDLIYDVLRQHDPYHLLLRAAWDDAADGLIDIHRLGRLLKRIKGRIAHKALETVSPLAMPVLLEIGRESIYGQGHDSLLAEAADQLIGEAMRIG